MGSHATEDTCHEHARTLDSGTDILKDSVDGDVTVQGPQIWVRRHQSYSSTPIPAGSRILHAIQSLIPNILF
jgi:hypothetical protein